MGCLPQGVPEPQTLQYKVHVILPHCCVATVHVILPHCCVATFIEEHLQVTCIIDSGCFSNSVDDVLWSEVWDLWCHTSVMLYICVVVL